MASQGEEKEQGIVELSKQVLRAAKGVESYIEGLFQPVPCGMERHPERPRHTNPLDETIENLEASLTLIEELRKFIGSFVEKKL